LFVAKLAVEICASIMVLCVISWDTQDTVLLPLTLLFKNVTNFHIFFPKVYLVIILFIVTPA